VQEYFLMLLLLFMLPAHAQDTAIITPENVHLVALEHVVIPTGSRLDTVIYAPAADLVAMTGIDLGIYICQTDQPYTDDLTGYEPPFALRLFRGCQNIRLSDGGSMKAMFATLPRWSPDGSRLAFSLLEGIGIINVPDEGFGEGTEVEVMSLTAPRGALDWWMVPDTDNLNLIEVLSWSPDGTMHGIIPSPW